MLAFLRTAGLIGLFTVLIWLWAEGESLATQSVSPRIEFVSPRSDLVVRLDAESLAALPGDSGAAALRGGSALGTRLRLQGTRASMDKALRLLTLPLKLTPGVGTIPATSGIHLIDLREAIAEHPDFRHLAITVLEAEPPAVRLVIEPLNTPSMSSVIESIQRDPSTARSGGTPPK